MKTIELTCINCPMGCLVTVTLDGDTIISVTGHTCPRGDTYARKEVTSPTRIVTSTVRVEGGSRDRVSCKTASDIPKDKIFDVMKAIDAASVKAPVKIGDVLIKDAASAGADVIATSNVS
jgi:Uncharacterized protein with conserved CXXC pairs